MAQRTLLLLLLVSLPLRAESLHIAVASNFAPTLSALLPLFQRQYPQHIAVSAAASGVLFQQIMNGAPFDLFLSADEMRPRQLELAGRIHPGSRATYAIGELVIAGRDRTSIPAANDGATLRHYLGSRPDRSLAIAEPAIAPYGLAAKQVYDHLGAWRSAAPSRITASNVSQVAMLIATGSVDAGFIARAQLRGNDWHALSLPADSYTAVQQQLVLLGDAPARIALDFLAFMQSDAARAIILEHGYRLP